MTDRVEAHLVYDTKAEPLRPGVRAAVQRARRCLYAADESELVIQTAPDRQPECRKLSGQVLDEGMPIEGAAVSLLGAASSVQRETDEDGEFVIGSVPCGAYSLEIDTPARQISVTPLQVD